MYIIYEDTNAITYIQYRSNKYTLENDIYKQFLKYVYVS